ncbi:MAG: hypothetical protein P1S59_12760 [bacterium]|nr:hypothetical protein [bacterium]
MRTSTLKITVTAACAALLIVSSSQGFTGMSGNKDQSHGSGSAGQSTAPATQEVTFVPPAIIINGVQVNPELVMSQLKMNCLGSSILHGVQIFDDWSPDHCPEVVDLMIGRELLNREAVKAGITVTDQEFEEVFRQNLDGLGGQEKAKGFFAPLGFTIDDYRVLSRHTYLARKYTQEVLAPEVISSREVEQYYGDNIDILSGVETLIYSYVGVRFTGETDDGFIKRMEADAGKVTNTAGMKELAARYRRELGQKGIVAQVYLNEVNSLEGGTVFRNAVGVEPGSTTFFANTKGNGEVYHIILLVEAFSPREGPTYEEVKPGLKERMITEQTNNAINAKVRQLKDAAVIRVVQE